jgi:hypothetical protein
MSETRDIGKAIRDAFLFLEPIFSDTAKLLRIVEDAMTRANFVSLWGSVSAWDRSWAFYGHYGWIAHYLNRLYVPKPSLGRKPDLVDKTALFVCVYFRPENLSQPIVMSGVVKVRDEQQFWTVWHDTMAKNAGPAFLNQEQTEGWAVYSEREMPALEKVCYQIRPLVGLKDKHAVEKLCAEAVEKFNFGRIEKVADEMNVRS